MSTAVRPTLGSPLAGYRADLGARERPFGPGDDQWLAVATVVNHAAHANDDTRGALMRDAVELAQEIVDDASLSTMGEREWGTTGRWSNERLLLAAWKMSEAGAFRLAGAMLDDLLRADQSLDVLQRGRILSQRARISRLLDEFDDARERYLLVASLGRRAKSAELKVRALNGLAALAQMRGNYPEMTTLVRRAIRRLQDGYVPTYVARTSHHAMMVAAAYAKQFDEALAEGWNVYRLSEGNAVDEASTLANLGQLLLESEQFGPAEAAFRSACARPLPARVLLAVLGGLALASAANGNEAIVEWAAREVAGVAAGRVPAYALALALLECGRAFAELGRLDDARGYGSRALTLARDGGFHEVEIRSEGFLEELATLGASGASAREALVRGGRAPTPRRSRQTALVCRQIELMSPATLPLHVRAEEPADVFSS